MTDASPSTTGPDKVTPPNAIAPPGVVAAPGVEVSLSLATTTSVAGDRLNLIVTDLSEIAEAHSLRDRAERESRTKDEFLAVFAHELRNPLGAISSAARLLEVTRGAAQPSTRGSDGIARQIQQRLFPVAPLPLRRLPSSQCSKPLGSYDAPGRFNTYNSGGSTRAPTAAA